MPSALDPPLVTTLPLNQKNSAGLTPKAVAPLHNPPWPSTRSTLPTRTLSSAPASPASSACSLTVWGDLSKMGTEITPPATPPELRRSSSSDQMLGNALVNNIPQKEETMGSIVSKSGSRNEYREEKTTPSLDKVLEFPSLFIPVPGPASRPQEYGRGVWSIVYKATLAPLVPPSPPASPEVSRKAHQLLAIKSPIHRTSIPVLLAEAKLLTYLSSLPGHSLHIVPFYGFHTPTSSIVLSAIPLTLTTYINSAASHARTNFSTRTMFDPIMGTHSWIRLAHQLISTLSWLHDTALVIHADIKPGNILLQPTVSLTESSFPYQVLLSDFSSSFHASSSPVPSSLALTTSFSAPELLLKHTVISPSKASDVYALATTLIAAATGDTRIYPTQYEIQRLAMAREGRPIEFVRMGNQGTRIRRGGIVERAVGKAVARDPAARVTTSQWLKIVEEIEANA